MKSTMFFASAGWCAAPFHYMKKINIPIVINDGEKSIDK
jgi:hypothetical protein